MADWASHLGLQAAVTIGLRDPETALTNLRAFVDFDAIRAFVITQRPQWQEVAVVDNRRLILWHGNHTQCAGHDRPPHPIFQSSVRTVMLSRLSDQALHTEYDVLPGGTHDLESVLLKLYTPTPTSTIRTTVEDSQHYVESFTFHKSLDDGVAQMHRLLDFAAAVSIAA